MFEHDPQFFRHSMTTAGHRATKNGASRSMWIILCSIFGILCLLQFPVVDGAFSCPSNCTCETFKVSGVKYQNITCVGQGLTEVPSDGKEGADVVKLILSNNQISSINQSSFQYFSSLVELDLSNNQITSVHEDVFSNLTSLQILDISHMSLTDFPKSALKKIDGLLEIDVSYNNITELPKNCLKRNSLVQKLDVSHNYISTVHSDAFKDDDGLTNLNLSYNLITTLDSKFFDDVDLLEILDISHNLLTTLDTDLFEDTPLITNLYLDNNQLSSLPSDVFESFTSISNIDLSRNSFSFLSSSIFSSISGYSLDVSNNPFACDCIFRNFLYSLEYQNNLANKESVRCTESGISYVYLDWDGPLCSGNLGSSCSNYQECMVQHSTCTSSACVCKPFYYDNNGLSSPAGLCKPQLNLGGACTFDSMCNTTNAYCGSNSKCICQSAYYDDNTDSVDGGECLPKILLNSACNYTEQCATTNSECRGNVCACTAGFYEIENSGLCQGPASFYSCYPSNTSSVNINFAYSASKSSTEDCEEYCFNQTARYYVLVSNICLCGNVDVNGTCCPKVTDTCQSREFIGTTVGYVKSGMNVTAIPQLYVGQANTFSVTTNLSIIDQIRWQFGASQTEVIVNSSSSSYSFTYTYSGKFDLTIKACVRASSVCDIVTLPVRVQVPRQNLTTYITGRTLASISGGISDFYATFKQGYDFEYYWQIQDSSSVKTLRKGCTSGWTAHRSKCLKLSASSASFSTAKANCRSQNATLLEISYLEEIPEIVTVLGASSVQLMTGAEKVGGVWQWSSDGAKTVFSDSHLTSSTSGNCAIIDGPSQSLTSFSCSASSKYACMIDPVDCPHGGHLLENNHCVVLASTVSASKMAWSNAQSYCETNFGGWLANITSAQVHSTLSSILNTSSVSEALFGLSDQILEGYLLWSDDTSFTAAYTPTTEASSGNCYVTKQNNIWAKTDCTIPKDFFCEYSTNIERLTVPSFLVGTPDVKISPGSNLQQVVPFDTFTDTSISTEIVLFPGLWITKSGKIRSWIVHTVNIGSGESFDGAFQIYRPTCASGSLVQPGCLNTKFATCSMTIPTCTQNTCSTSQHFCYLSNTCKSFNESCTCNSESGSTIACSASGDTPQYTIHAETHVTVAVTGENVVVIPAGDLSVQEHDIIGFQFPYGQNFIKSETVPSGHDQQATYKVNHTGWLSKKDIFPTIGRVDEEKTYYFHAVYTETQTKNLSQSQAYAKVVGEYDLSITVIDTDMKELDVTLEEAIDDIEVVYPTKQENSTDPDNLGTIYTEYNQAYDITVRVGRGNNKRFSFDSSASVTFQSHCSSSVQNTIPSQDLCNASLVWSDKPFAYVNYNTTTTGSTIKTLTVSNSLGTTTKYITIRTEKKIEGVNFTLQTTALIQNNVAVNRESSFSTTFATGTEVSFSYQVNGVNISSTSSSMKHTFTSIGTFTVTAFLTNILGVESANLTVYVKQPAEFSSCIYVGTPYIAVINVPIAIVVECTVNVNAEVSAQFDFGDNTAYTLANLTTSSTKETWTYSKTFTNTALDVQVNSTIKDPFEAVTVSTTVDVYNQIPSVSLLVSDREILLGNITLLNLTVPSSPGNYGNVIFSADFGDSTNATNISGLFTHTYGSAGSYNIKVTASNGPSLVSINQTVIVYSVVDGLNAYYNGPNKKGDTTVMTASNTDGNLVSFRFYSSEFNVTQTSGVFSYIFATAGTHTVDIICSNALSSKNISLTVYVLNATDIILRNLRLNGVNLTGCIESGITNIYSVSLIHYDAINLQYNWDFGDNTTLNTTTTSGSHSYLHGGNYTLNVTVIYSQESARKSISADICIQDKIESPSLNVSNQIGLPSTGTLNLTILVTLVRGSSVSYLWTSNATILSSSSSPTLTVQITGYGFYTFSVSVSNSLSSERVARTVEVIEEISGVTITCASCTEESGNFYTQTSQNSVYSIQTTTGTSLSYTWNMGDSTTNFGSSVTHAYSSIGSYTIVVSVSNAVHRVNQTKIVYVESALTSVVIQTYLFEWRNNKVNIATKDLDISQTAKLIASVQPTGMSPIYHWRFDTSLPLVTTTSNIGEYNFTTTGLKTCTVTASNNINNITATTFNFYVIERLTSLNVKEGNTILTNSTHLVPLNHVINISVTSSQIVDGSVIYHLILKDPTNRFAGSSSSSSLSGSLSSTGTYTLIVSVENSINIVEERFYFEVIQAVSGPYISVDSGVDGNITLGSSIDLYGGSITGKYLTFSWAYLSAPSGQSFTSSDQNVTLTPTEVGQYVVRLTVTNPVSSNLNVEFTIKVMQAVTGVSISASLSPPDAVKVSTTVIFQATVTTGSDLSYSWIALGGINPVNGDTANFTVTFGLQAYYNITLNVSNYASSGSDVKQIYALHEVSAFNILVNSGAIYNNDTKKYVVISGQNVTFSSDITSTEFIEFDWTINSTSNGTNKDFYNVFSTVGTYIVTLTAFNKISSVSDEVTMLIQKAISNFVLTGCNATYLLNSDISLSSTFSTGTDVSVEWKHSSVSNGTSIVVSYSTVGEHPINVTASNYVSTVSSSCIITIQGTVANLNITVSQYKFVGHAISFNVTGDYLTSATFLWKFSHGITNTTTTASLDQIFSAKGSYSLTVNVSNVVSWSEVSVSFTVEDLKCSLPSVRIDGSSVRTTVRARSVELAVTVSTSGCTEYTSVNRWIVYEASSCGASLTTTYSLSSGIAINTPILQLPAATLQYNSYCIVFEISYSNTPVVKYAYFNITIGESPLMALISGGDSRAASAGTTLTLDGSTSHDPDSSGATLVYTWSCSQNMGTSSAINVCNKINAVTTANATIIGVALTKNDVYNVTLTVSATGRTSGLTSQKITITDAGAPVVAMECVSCAANENYYVSTSKKTCFKGICYSGCNSSTTYLWTVTDTSTSTDLSIGTSQTTTGTDTINFCLSAGTLQDAKAYKFKLEATTGTATGFAEQSHSASTVPQSGNCSLSSTGSRIVPLSDQVTATCQFWSDQDSMSGLYYKIVASYGSDSYIINYGTQPSTDFYMSPWPGTNYADVTITISVVNDHGIEVTALTENVQFQAPTLLLSQTDYVSYLVDQVISTMPTIAKQNNPNLLVRYSIAALMFLNDQSENNINTTAVRMAIRDLFSYSLDGVPYSSVNDIRQIASAVKYLSEYPNELSKSTLSKVDTAISTLSSTLDSSVRQGHDQNDFKTDSLLEAITNVHSSLQSITSTTRDSVTWTKFGTIDNYGLDISNRSSTTSFTSDSAMQRELTKKSIEYRTQLAIVQLKTLLPDEEAVNKTLTDGSTFIAQHVSVSNIPQELSQSGVALFIPTDILDYTTYTQDSVYHITVFDNQNPFNFGYDTEVPINTKTLQTGFHDLTGNSISVSSLPSSKEVVLYMFLTDVSTYSIPAAGIMNATGYNPREGVTNKSCTDLTAGRNKYMPVAQPSDSSASIHIQILPEFSSSQASGQLTATLLKNDVAYTSSDSLESAHPLEVTHGIYSNNKTDHTTYTFYIPASERGSNAFKVQLSSNLNVHVCVALYYGRCSYFNTNSSTWASDGCTPQEESIPTVSKCQCNHMTSYGSGLLLSPDQIDFTDLTDLDIVNNPVAIITCSIILGMYIVLVIICRKMDLLDIKHISSIPLCGKDGSFKYNVMVFTGRQFGAGTSAHVGIQLLGSYWKTAQKHIYKEGAFQRNCCDTFIIAHDVNLGEVKKIRIWHDNTGTSPSWYLDHVVIHDLQTDQQYYFYCQSWLTLETTNGTIHKKIQAAGSQDRNRFGRRFKTAMFNSLADKHLWLSLLNRPAQSRFTRVQRATCCVTLLFTFICVNAMWYGLLKKDNQDLGWDNFSWEEIVLAIVTNVMVLPINLGLIFLFKKSRTKANLFETLQKPQTAQTIEIENYCENSQGGSFESRNTGEIPFDLDRESTIDSVPANTRGLHRSRHVSRRLRENTDDSLDRGKRPSVAVTNSSRSPPWDEDSSMRWSEVSDSPVSSTTAGPSTRVQKTVGGKQAAGAYKKHKTIGKIESDELNAELDKMEKELKELELRPVRSASSRHSSTSARSRRLTISEIENLNDILHSDDESGTGHKGPKTKSKTGARFNPRADPRINGNGNISRGSALSGLSQESESSNSGVAAGLRPAYYSELTMESRDIRQVPIHKEKCSLPPWCIYVAYVLCFLLCVFSVVIVILYCFKFGADEALKWVLACLLSLVLSFCVVEPLKALMIAVYMVAMMKNVDKNDEDDCIEIDPTIDMSHERIQEQTFEPMSGFALIKATEEGRKIRRMKTIIRQFFAYMFYLWVIMVIVYVHFHYNSYLFNKYVETSFINSTTTNYVSYNNISTIDEFWDWTENVFAESLHLQDSHTDEEHGFLLGAARMRLIRSLTEKCHASSAASSLGASVLTDRICYGDGGFEEDTAFYGERWNESSYNKSWKYMYANELGGSDKLGFVATYSGGGYLQTLGTSYAETLTIIQDLKDKGWIDLRTRAVVFEFSFYSPGSDMTAVTAMLVEFPLTGGVITSYDILSQRLLWFQENRVDPLMVMECILLLVVIYSCVHIALQIREKKAAYFKEFWHWYEMITTLATIVSVGMYMGCVIEATNTFNNFLDDQSGFTNFERVAHVHVGMRYLYAWLLFLIMFKVVRQLQFIKFLYVYGITLRAAFRHILGACLIYVILLLTYAQLGYLMYGRAVPGFESVGHAISTLVVIIRGTFNFWPMLNHQPVFSHFYLYTYYAFAYGILVALVISILQSSYRINKSKMYYKDSLDMKDYEMIEFMINRFKLWAGIKKQKPAFRRVHFPDLPSVSSRASTSHSNRSSESTESTNTTFEPESYEPYLKRMAGRLGPTWQLFLRRFDEVEILDQEEQRLVTKTEALVKDLNLRCRINELERQGKEILSWHKSSSSKPPVSDSKLRQSQRLANRDNHEQKAPSTVTGVTSRVAATPPGKEPKAAQSKRPLSDQGARAEQTSERRASVPEKNKLQKFLKSVKPSKPAWNKDS